MYGFKVSKNFNFGDFYNFFPPKFNHPNFFSECPYGIYLQIFIKDKMTGMVDKHTLDHYWIQWKKLKMKSPPFINQTSYFFQ